MYAFVHYCFGGRRLLKTRVRILAVDDDMDVLRNLALMLSFEDYHVMTASSGMEAVSLLQQYQFDAVITDLRMPVIDGIEIVRRTQAMCPKTAIIVTSRYFDDKTINWIHEKGVNSLQKPYNVHQLSAMLRSFNLGQYEESV
jgi:CheY-like chemotaxis protein